MKKPLFAIGVCLLATPALAHDPINSMGSEVQILLDADGTGGSMGMFTVNTPAAEGPPRHVHSDADEAFYLLEGEAEVLNGDKMLIMSPGEAAYVEKGKEHTFRFVGENGGKILVIVAPAGFEGFFDAVKHLKVPDDLEKITEISERFGQSFTGPPLGAD